MPWRNTSTMGEKIQFINEWRSGAWSVRAVCAAFGISHTLGYKYTHRWEAGGVPGLHEPSRAPRSHPTKTPARVHVHLPREYPQKIDPRDYPKHFLVRYVSRNAAIRPKSYSWVMVATPLAGRYVGLEELGNGIWRVFYRHKLLGYLDKSALRIEDERGRKKRGRSGHNV